MLIKPEHLLKAGWQLAYTLNEVEPTPVQVYRLEADFLQSGKFLSAELVINKTGFPLPHIKRLAQLEQLVQLLFNPQPA